MTRILLVAVLALGGLACSGESAITGMKLSETDQTIAQREFLIGSWRGEAPIADGGTRHWIAERHPDGTYRIDFTHTNVLGAPDAISEIGIWGVSGGIYFSATRGFVHRGETTRADTTDATLYDTYRIIALDDDVFEYESLSTGNRFTANKVRAPSGAL